ncbi:MAG: hypothetical protein BV457_02155 [Thermoplasmata archaeon M9B1D]|nr:MAG: hypothetical protein BV457_02155 [Thermoplasmata archaeon M9B1D]PNX50355.1 MAG: hypothetical protein BV456_06965 [Thermoplasmata archaeon M8B2D]
MKKYVLIFICFILIGCNIDLNVSSLYVEDTKENNILLTIETPSFKIVEKNSINQIFVENFGRLSILGGPILPSKIISIALPPGATYSGFSYEFRDSIMIPGEYTIPPLPIADLADSINVDIKKEYKNIYNENYQRIYTCDNLFPVEPVEFINTAFYRQYNLVDFRISPFIYRPLSKTLSYYPSFKIKINYEESDTRLVSNIREKGFLDQIAQDYIINYDQTSEWYQESTSINDDVFDFVIITLDSLQSSINSLVEWEIAKGRSVNVVTISWIDDNYQGYDLAEKIRNFLRDKYPVYAWGIEDVLIIGHWEDIPMRLTDQQIDSSSNKAETDYYYAELSLPDNESWDIDGDHRYGENSDQIDFYGEVNVGRIPWSDPEIVEHICEKSVSYEQNNETSYKKNILLLGAIVDQNTDGAVFMEYKTNENIHPWMSSWLMTKMYESESIYPKDYVLNHNNVVSVWADSKFAFVSWHAHGSPTGSYANNRAFISVDDCQYLNDEYPAIISSASCSNSDTDYLNIGQAMMKQGAVGFLGANKAAFYRSQWDEPNDGSDQSMKYFFTTAITSGEYTQGQAHQYAIHEMYSKGLWDRLYYETFVHGSLWGNPDLGIFTVEISNPPNTPQRPSGPSSGKILENYSFSSSTIDSDADDIYYEFDWDDGTNSGWIGPHESGKVVSASHIWKTKGTYSVKVKAKDIHGAESDWSDSLVFSLTKNKPFIALSYLEILKIICQRFQFINKIFLL